VSTSFFLVCCNTDESECRPNTVLMFIFMEQLQRLVAPAHSTL
jgi:hypothetical protein